MSITSPGTKERIKAASDQEVGHPPMYRVLLHNDDYTSMEFVVEVLMTVFHKGREEASRIMMNVHNNGIGVCGVYTYEVAETKVSTVHILAAENEFPLKSTMERA